MKQVPEVTEVLDERETEKRYISIRIDRVKIQTLKLLNAGLHHGFCAIFH